MGLPTITVFGNLKRLETKVLQSGKQVTKFQIECAEKNSKGEYTNLYLSGEVWDKASEFVSKFFVEGSLAIVTGKLYTNVYENQEGKKIYENKLLFPNVDFAPRDRSDNSTSANNAPQQQQQQSYQQPQQSHTDYRQKPIEIDEESLPF